MREFIFKPPVNGVPISWANKFFLLKLKKFRDDHVEFDGFLKELKNLIEEEQLDYCSNIVKFIDGQCKTNWICTSNSLFVVLIRLYNYDLSPKQTLNYIKKCYQYLLKLESLDYKLFPEYEIYQNSQKRTFIRATLIAKCEEDLSFKISFSHTITKSVLNDINCWSDVNVKVKTINAHAEDTLMLFEYYQTLGYLESLLDKTINYLIECGAIIKRKETKEWYGNSYEYEFLKPVGIHSIYEDK